MGGRNQKTNASMQTQRVLYLAGLELRSTQNGNMQTESLQAITVGEAGRAQVRVLHWESGKPQGIDNNQVRWSYDNLIGSSGLELDGEGNIISLITIRTAARRYGRRAAKPK